MLALIMGVYAAFGMTAGSIPPLVGTIIDDLEMTSGQMGLVLGAWQLIFIGTASPLGTLVDRIGERKAIAIGLLVVLASLVLRGLAVNFPTLLLAVAIFGMGGPIISVGVAKVVALWFEGRERGTAAGSYIIGRDIGTAIALGTAASFVLSLTGSWRGISLVYGGFVFLVLVAWLLFARDAPAERRGLVASATDAGAPSVPALGQRGLLKLRNVQVVLLLGFTTFLLSHGLQNWLPTLLEESGMTIEQAGRWVALSMLPAMVGHIVLPTLARYGYRGMALFVLLALSAVTTAGLAFLTGPALIVVLLVGTMVRLPTLQIITLVLMETKGVGAARIGGAAGLFFTVAEVGGFSGPLMLGIIRDATGSLEAGVLALAIATGVLMTSTLLIREPR